MTIPNVNTSLSDESFFVDLNGDDTSDCVAVFFDLSGYLLKCLGNTNERNIGVMEVNNPKDWVYRLYSEESTGVDPLPDIDYLEIESLFNQPFLGVDNTVASNPFTSGDIKRAIYQYNGYTNQEYTSSELGVPNSTYLRSPSLDRSTDFTYEYSDVDARTTTDFAGNNVDIPRKTTKYFSSANQPTNKFDAFTDILGTYTDFFGSLSMNSPIVRSSSSYTLNQEGTTGPTGGVIESSFLFSGLTYGNALANTGRKRWNYGPVYPWAKSWHSIYQYLKYGGRAIIFSSYEEKGNNQLSDLEFIDKISASKYSFDLIISLSRTENEFSRTIANVRKDCIAITYVDRSFTETVPGLTTSGIPQTPKPFVENLGGLFKLRYLPDSELFLAGGTSGITSGFGQSFGTSSEFINWIDNNYLNRRTYPSKLIKWNYDTGEITRSSYGLDPGSIDIVRFYDNYHSMPLYLQPSAFDSVVFNDDNYVTSAPGIKGSHASHPAYSDQDFLGFISNLYGFQIEELPYSIYGITYQNSSISVGEQIIPYPIFPVMWDNTLNFSYLFSARQLFYPAGQLKYFGVSGSSMDSDFHSKMNGITECSYKYKNLFETSLDAGNSGLIYNTQSGWTFGYFDDNPSLKRLSPLSDWEAPSPYSINAYTHQNLPIGDPDAYPGPYYTPFIDVRKTFNKAREQWVQNGNSYKVSSLDDMIFLPSDINNVASSYLTMIANNWDQSPLTGTISIGLPSFREFPDEVPGNFGVFEADLFTSIFGLPSNNLDSGYGFPNSQPTDYYVGNTSDKVQIIQECAEANFLDYYSRLVGVVNIANIYTPTLPKGTSHGEPGWWLNHPDRIKWWGCTCAGLPSFFQEFFHMGTTQPVALGTGFPPSPTVEPYGWHDIDCIEFGPNGTTTDVLAPGSTYCAFIGFRNRHPRLYIHNTDLAGNSFGATASEYPSPINPYSPFVDIQGSSYIISGTTTDTHPGLVRGGSFANLYLPFLTMPGWRTFDDIPVNGVPYGRSTYSRWPGGYDTPQSLTLRLKSKYNTD